MKKEFATAIGLLALGCLLWWWLPTPAERAPLTESQRPELNTGSDAASQDQVNLPGEPRREPAHEALPHPNATAAHRSRQSLAPAAIDRQPLRSVAVEAYLHTQTDPESVGLLAETSESTAQSAPWGAALQLQGTLFGQTLRAHGRYFQKGQGTHHSRLELAFGDDPQAPTVFQLCDGRFVYRLQTVDSDQTIEFVDLRRVVETTGELPSAFAPTSWVATGGLSSLWQHLGSAFALGPPQRVGKDLIVIRGSWKPTALARVLGQNQQVRWGDIPPQLPHAVELTLRRNDLVGQAPVQISYARFELDSEDQPIGVVPTLIVSFSTPQPLTTLDDQLFVMNSEGVPLTDTTDQYIARIQEARHQQAAVAPATLDR